MLRALAVGSIFFVLTLVPSAWGARDDVIQVEVERPQLIVDNANPKSPGLAFFKLVFDARFTNQSKAPVDIPDLAESPSGAVGVSWNGVESQESDGSWRFVVNGGTLLWRTETVFAKCRSLDPKVTEEFKGISGPLVAYKTQLVGLTAKPTLRLTLVLTCNQRDGKMVLKSVLTKPFIVSIPSVP